MDKNGSLYAGDGRRWEDWYGYNKKVLTAADGIVHKVVDRVDFPIETLSQQDGESFAEYMGRIDQRQLELFTREGADLMEVAGGNHIIIRHDNGEYSFYAHLAGGSVKVKEGQTVKQGEHIAGVGGTGENPWVHLHFQVNKGPEILSPGLFFDFIDVLPSRTRTAPANMRETRTPNEPGQFITLNR